MNASFGISSIPDDLPRAPPLPPEKEKVSNRPKPRGSSPLRLVSPTERVSPTGLLRAQSPPRGISSAVSRASSPLYDDSARNAQKRAEMDAEAAREEETTAGGRAAPLERRDSAASPSRFSLRSAVGGSQSPQRDVSPVRGVTGASSSRANASATPSRRLVDPEGRNVPAAARGAPAEPTPPCSRSVDTRKLRHDAVSARIKAREASPSPPRLVARPMPRRGQQSAPPPSVPPGGD